MFGAFLLGAIVPHESRHRRARARSRIEDLVRVLLLPAFFAFTGMRTQIGLLQTAQDWLLCGVIIVGRDRRQVRRHGDRRAAHRPELARQRRRSAS